MAVDTISSYLETGTVKNSVNFPTVIPPERIPDSIRLVIVTKNEPGMLARITEICASHNLNIMQQVNNSRGDVAYNVIDVDSSVETVKGFKDLQKELTMLEGVLNTRIIFSQVKPGRGFARNVDGDYFA